MKKTMRLISTLFMFLAVSILVLPVQAEDTPGTQKGGDADLAQELSNPLADLMTIPIQLNYDHDIGPLDDGSKLQTNIQPVIPFKLNVDRFRLPILLLKPLTWVRTWVRRWHWITTIARRSGSTEKYTAFIFATPGNKEENFEPVRMMIK